MYMYARIAIGYCYESQGSKSNALDSNKDTQSSFITKAIEHFENLLHDLLEMKSIGKYSSVGTLSINPDRIIDYIVELHHGLGHFYNKRALLHDDANNPARDILVARQHMRYALKARPETFSVCYGSLFHEYRDYGSALDIFNSFMDSPKLRNDEKLMHELRFYIAQTEALHSEGESLHSQILLNEFEEYSRKSLFYDGIIHARIIRARSFLRDLPFADIGPQKKEKTAIISKLYNQLTEFSLSNYADMSICDEYDKTKYMLRVYQSLYFDDDFVLRLEDMQYNLTKFIELIPENARIRCEDVLSDDSTEQSCLYATTVGKLDIWCISVSSFLDELCQNNRAFITAYRSVEISAELYRKMEDSGQTNYIAVFLPDGLLVNSQNNSDEKIWTTFKQVILSLTSSQSNLCFII